MRVKKTRSTHERDILIGMITNSIVCRKIVNRWKEDLFDSRWANLISRWCRDFYQQYETAPNKEIESLFRVWSEKVDDDKTVTLIETFLSKLSSQYEMADEINPDYLVDRADQHFTKVSLARLTERIEDQLTTGQVNEAIQAVASFERVNLGAGRVIDMIHSDELYAEAFDELEENLFVYPGALGKFFQNQLSREGFIAFVGPEKRGKSFWLLDLAFRASMQRRRTVIFEAGDMTERQVAKRFCTRVARHPWYPGKIYIPTHISPPPEATEGEPYPISPVKRSKKLYRRGIDPKDVIAGRAHLIKRRLKSQQSYLRLSCHSNSSLTVGDIENYLLEWSGEGWVPDVVVIDYADILRMDYPGMDYRNSINHTWKLLRKLSQDFHVLLVTASQTNSASYRAYVLTTSHFSEDKRKLAHVTGMVGLNATDDEMELGLMRLNWIIRREGEPGKNQWVNVAGCRAIGNPAIKSCL